MTGYVRLKQRVEVSDPTVLDNLRMVTDPTHLTATIQAIAGLDGIDAIVGDVPGSDFDVMRWAVWANRQIVLGWRIRTDKPAKKVSKEQFEGMHERLRAAEIALIEICARQPDFAYAWYCRLLTARGLELGMGEARRRHQRLVAVAPDYYQGHTQFLQRILPKWGGTWEEAFSFARTTGARAPAGSPSRALVGVAHFERWCAHDKAGRAGYYSPEIAGEMDAAAAASCEHSDFTARYLGDGLHELFAAFFSAVGDQARAAHHFKALPPDAGTTSWWGYFGNAAEQFDKRRLQALGGVQ